MNDPLGRHLARVRLRRVLPHVRGRLLDVGCGNNRLVEAHRRQVDPSVAAECVGIDVYPWPDVDRVVEDTRELPFPDRAFDTVTIVAALNHIPYREQALAEVSRVLAPEGRLVMTMIPAGVSRVWHLLRKPWDADQTERGMSEGEVWGLSRRQVRAALESARFAVVHEERFMLGLNRLTVARRRAE